MADWRRLSVVSLVSAAAALLSAGGIHRYREHAALRGCVSYESVTVVREARVTRHGVFVSGRKVASARVGTCYRFTITSE